MSIKRLPIPRTYKEWLTISAIALSYYLTGHLGLSLEPVGGFASLVWAPSGIALASLLIYGYSMWPGVLIAAAAVNFIQGGASLPAALAIGIGNTLEAVAATWALRRFVGFENSFDKVVHVTGYIIFAAVISTAIAASVGATTIFLDGAITLSGIDKAWFAWWLGDALGILIVAPLLVSWLPNGGLSIQDLYFSPKKLLEYAVILALSFGLTALLFGGLFLQRTGIALIYLIFLPVLWCSFRLPFRFGALAIAGISSIAVFLTLLGRGPFAQNIGEIGLFDKLLLLQLFTSVLAITHLLLNASVAERMQALDSLHRKSEDLALALDKLKEEENNKNEFIAILGHELRNPLAVILSSIEILMYQSAKSPFVKYGSKLGENLERMISNVSMMTRLLDDMVDIAQIARREYKIQQEEIDIRVPLLEAIEEIKPQTKFKRQELTTDLPKQAILMKGDPTRIKQIVLNLLTNAFKYTDSGGDILVTCHLAERRIVITVKDSGIGITPENLKNVFMPFFRERSEKLIFRGGIGVGMHIAKILTELHGGAITAKSEGINLGSEFTVYLPALASQEVSPEKLASG